ncbi:MAG TPA: HlyD family efflux transporter periplasmic adaptor subunit [Oligoflexia bacterium]|nr:HlyD family efflux transporter periplasmic adaptor subunit [Oligoflexia bacterium]HMR23815.1 HlyD family efflux transporter periplasmic adaptor subunit [Oligoflexia bacterium]
MNLNPIKGLTVVFVFLFGSCQLNSDKTEEQKYLFYSATQEDLVNYIETSGTVEPKNNVGVVAPSKGRIDKLLIEEGDQVKKGQVIAIMSSDKRVQILDMAANESLEERQYWKKQILPTKIFSPISGTVLEIVNREGDTVSGEIAKMSDGQIVRASIDEIDITKIKLNSEVIINFDADESKTFSGKLEKIAQTAQKIRNVNVYPIEVSFDEEDLKNQGFTIRSGMSVTIRVPVDKVENAIAIPSFAANNQSNKEISVVMKNGVTKKIKLGDTFGDKVHVINGLNAGDEIRVKAFKAETLKKKSILNFFK